MGDRTLPTGTLTFLFTDVEGSTRLVHELGDRYGEVLEVHRTLIRGAVAAHGGVEFGTGGDALFIVFDSAAPAVAAAADAQRALAAHAWPAGTELRVRMAVHTGEARVVDDDYVGVALHVVARLCAAAHGGQVLISPPTHALASATDVESLGSHQLRDLPDSIEVFQLRGDGLVDSFPPLRTLSTRPNNLPIAADALVGRQREIVEVTETLVDTRIVTLTGPGGVGKTRLALEVASAMLPALSDGAWLAQLGAATTPDQVEALTAQALKIGEPFETTHRQLAGRNLLLVLDNCEHLVSAAADMVDALLAHCPTVRVLATSREVLDVRGEHAIAVSPLVGVDARRLFVTRARAAVPGFDEASEDVAVVDDICRRLDGLPLAIELAAARLRGVSLRRIGERLDDRFRMLGSSHGRSLEAVIAWSYDLLAPDEQAAFRRLAIFADSFDLDSAERVAGWGLVGRDDVVDLVTRLVATSMLAPVRVGDDYRYRMLETIRAYGRDKLAESGERDDCLAHVRAWAARWTERLETDMRTERQEATIAAAISDRDNLRAVYEHARAIGEDELALRIVTFVPLAQIGERGAAIDELLASVGEVSDGLRAHALTARAQCASDAGQSALGVSAARRSAEIFDALGDRRHAAWARYFEVFGLWGSVDDAEVRALLPRLVTDFRELDDRLGLAYMLWVMSQLEPRRARADAHAAESEALFRGLHASFGLAHSLEGRALVNLKHDDPAIAAAWLAEAVPILTGSLDLGCLAHLLDAVAALSSHLDHPGDAVYLLAAADQLRERSGQTHRPWELRSRVQADALLAGNEHASERDAGGTADLDAIVARTLAMLERAGAPSGAR